MSEPLVYDVEYLKNFNYTTSFNISFWKTLAPDLIQTDYKKIVNQRKEDVPRTKRMMLAQMHSASVNIEVVSIRLNTLLENLKERRERH